MRVDMAGGVVDQHPSTERRMPEGSKRKSVYTNISYVPGMKIKFFSPPRQRQKWGSDHHLPHINWGDIFFDLFYVAGFYRMGNILIADPSPRGLLYAVGVFFPLINVWKTKMFYDSWFVYGDDIWHKAFETLLLLLLGGCIGLIGTAEQLSDPYLGMMFLYCVFLALVSILDCLRYVEAYFYGRGQRKNIKYTCRSALRAQVIPILFYIAAFVVIVVFNLNSATDGRRMLAEATSANATSGGATPAEAECIQFDLPVYLVIAGYLVSIALHTMNKLFCYPKDEEAYKKNTIPKNVDFCIHRQGDWVLLLLGESVLSLLIVDSEYTGEGFMEFMQLFFIGILTVCLLQLLHFRSQPHDAHAHAMKRSKNAGVLFIRVFEIYSFVLLLVGASIKLMMYTLAKEVKAEDRRLDSLTTQNRWLAAAGGDSPCVPSYDERKKCIIFLYSISLGLVFICEDLLTLAHVGLKKQLGKCELEEDSSTTGETKKKFNVKGVVFVLIPRILLSVLTLTLGLWVTDLGHLADYGCGIVFAQLIIRLLGNVFFPDDDCHGHHHHDGGVTDDEEEEVIKEDDDSEAHV